MAGAGAPLDRSRLVIEEVPDLVCCPRCRLQRQLELVALEVEQ